ncbi:MAG: ClpXP protease specificity-enhancing factor [Gammaproteobacteria bacterium RIFCSPHIGHO2_12_FULL_41_15]|nr:MAG: ClpXP protease specificity-enhancing factor [Gammaproteobacteria bacterium RIFCSPHIGHO2_12_FULL_41_15]
MTSSKPYLLRAIYEWLADNNLTPYVMVDATIPKVAVPRKFVEDGKIILNIAMQAVRHLELKNEAIIFQASFSGIIEEIYIPIEAVSAIYAYENGRGMVFGDEDEGGVASEEFLDAADDAEGPDGKGPDSKGSDSKSKKPSLKIIK